MAVEELVGATTMRTALAVVCGVPGGRMLTNGIALISTVTCLPIHGLITRAIDVI